MNRLGIVLLLFVCAFVCAGLVGCGRVHQLYYLQGEFPLDGIDGPMDRIYLAPDATSLYGKRLVVHLASPPETIKGDPKINKAYTPEFWEKKFRRNFERLLANKMWQTGVFSDVAAAGDYPPMANPDVDLRVAITEWDEGHGWLRVLFGFGLGASRMQWEGSFVDNKRRVPLLSFADARIHPGGPSLGGLGGRKALQGPRLVTQDLELSADDLMKVVREATGVDTPLKPREERRPTRVRQAAPPAVAPPPASAPKPEQSASLVN